MKEQKIVITTDGKITLARLYEDNKVVKRAEAKCCPSDTFDFKVSAELALSRVLEQEKEDIFPLADIKPGYLLRVEIGDEQVYMTVSMGKGKRNPFAPVENDMLICTSGQNAKHFWPLNKFGASLQFFAGGHTYSVLAVYGYAPPRTAMDNTPEGRVQLWEREVAPKAETKAETIIEVGDEVRIIGNSGPFHYLKIGSEAEVCHVRDKFLTVNGEDRGTGYLLLQTVSINDVELI